MGKIEQKKSTNINVGDEIMAKFIFETFTEILKSSAPDINIDKILETMEIIQSLSPFLDDIKKIIANTPVFRDIPLNEVVETKEFERIFKEIYETKYKDTAGAKESELFKSMLPKDFFLLVQNHTSNQLQKKLTTKITEPAQFDLLGNGTVASSDFRLFIRGYQELVNGVNQSAAMLLDSLMITATMNGLQSTLVKLPLREYMNMRSLKDEKETRAQVKRDIDALERVSFEYKGTGKQRGVWLKIHISGGTVGQIKNGDIIFRFNQDFFDSFKVSEKSSYLYMYFPREALKGNIRQNPHKYWLARQISTHKRMNLGKPNEDIIGVRTLIDACPNMPTYEDVMALNRNFLQHIIEPFERDMDALNETLSWHYNNSEEGPQDYQTFMDATVKIHWRYYPDTKKLEEARAKWAKKLSAPKKKKNSEEKEK